MRDHIELGSDENAFAIQGAKATAWAGGTLVEVTGEDDLPVMVLTADQWGPSR